MIVQEDAAGNIAPPSHGLSRVAHTSTSYIFSSLNGGANYAIFPYDRTTEEWDEDLTLAANATPALSHGGQMSMGPPNNATKLTRSEHFAFDSFGNLIDHTARTRGVNCVGDEDEETAVWTYPPDITNWLVGLPQTVKTWKSPHGMPLPAPRVVDYTYAPGASTPASFFVATETVEAGSIPGPGGTNPVPVQTTYVPTSEGLVDTVRVKEFTGEPARTTRYTYDSISHSFVATKINALAQTETYLTEPGFGVVVSSSDINGAATGAHTDIVLDDLGRPRQITRTGGITTTIAYSARLKAGADGIVTTIANSDGSTTITEADFGGRPKKESTVGFDGTLISRDSAYDLHGQLVTVSKPYQGAGPGIASAHGQTWDTLGRVVSEVEGKYTTQYLYDSVLSTRVVDPGLHTRVLNKSCDGRIASSIQKQTAPLPDVTTSYYYGNFDELTSVSDTKNNISKFGYDQRGRRISFVDGDSGVTGTAYNGFGDVTSTIAGGVLSGTVVTGGTATQYTHDVLGRVLTRSTPTDGLTKYQWDTSGLWGKGNIAYTISGAGLGAVRHDYAYDLLARPAGESWTIGGAAPLSTQQSYDNLGRLSIVTYPQAAGHSTFSTIQAYNAYGYPASIQGPCSGFICIRPIYWSTTTMDWDGHIVAGKYGNGITASRSWVNQELTAIHDGVITSLGYTYDADGLVLDRTDFAANRKETHHYDDLHRLHTYDLAYGSTANEKFDYDDLGNLTKWTRTGAGPKAVNYAYLDPNGKHRLTSATGSETYALGYDGGVAANRGRVTGDTQRTYTYTEFDLPRTIVQPSPIGGGNITTTFDYDGDNQRVRKSSSLGTTITLGGLFEKRTTPAGTVTDVYYIPGPEGVVAQLTVDETTQAETLEYLHHDNLGSVVAITNSAGALVSRLFYTPFGARADIGGNPISSAGGDVRLGLAELSFDDDLGLIDQRGRIYNPRSRHFLTADPHVTSPLNSQSWNSYSYVVNNPVNLVDPTGFDCAETGPGQVACTPVTITPERPENPASLAGETLGSRGGDWTESRPLVMRDDGLPGSAPDRDYVEERRQQVRGQAAQLISLLGGISAAPSPAERAANRDAMEAAAAGDFQPLTEVILGPPPKTIGEQIDRLVHPLDYPQLPAYQPGDRTRGWLKTGNGIYELHSGESGGPPAIPLPGRNSTNFTHVEAHAAQIMRVEGVMEATLEINRIPCGVGPGCANNLPHMLPEGATLRVVGPGGYDRTFIGLPDPARYPRK
jgi:RHS repeat-associated protein